MTERVRADPKARARGGDVLAHESIDASHGKASAAEIHEQRIPAVLPILPVPALPPLLPHDLFASIQVGANGFRRALIERHEPLLAALSEHPDHPRAEIEIVDVDTGELAEPQTRRVEQLEDRVVTPPEGRLLL